MGFYLNKVSEVRFLFNYLIEIYLSTSWREMTSYIRQDDDVSMKFGAEVSSDSCWTRWTTDARGVCTKVTFCIILSIIMFVIGYYVGYVIHKCDDPTPPPLPMVGSESDVTTIIN